MTRETAERVKLDPELRAMRDMAAAYDRVAPEARQRVAEWFVARALGVGRFDLPVIPTAPAPAPHAEARDA